MTIHAEITDRTRVAAEARPAGLRRVPAWAAATLPAVVMVLAAVTSWLRMAPVTHRIMWAEDLRNFLRDDVHHGLAPTLFQPYGGYLQVAPRLLAALVAHLVPMQHWAPAITFCACVFAGGVAAVVYVCAQQILHSRALGLAVASITVLDPLAAHEVLGNLANLHWLVIWMMPWVLLYRPTRRWAAWVLGAIVLVCVLSEFDVVLFLPLLAWRWRDRALLPVRVPYLMGCVAEVVAEIASPRHRPGHLEIGAADAISGYLINAVMSIVTPIRTQLGELLRNNGTMLGIALLVAAAALAAYVLRRGDARLRILTVLACVLSPALFISATELTPEVKYHYAHMNSAELGDPWLARYGVVPSMLLLALIPLAAAAYRLSHGRRPRHPASRAVALAAVAVLALPLLAHAGPANDQRRVEGPAFEPQVAEALQDCRLAPPDQRETLYAAPARMWQMTVSCAELESDAGRSADRRTP